MKASCISPPKNNRYIQICEWQVQFCKGNHCAAFVLSHFIAWHDWKLQHDEYYERSNNIAELHGEGRPHNQNAYLFFNLDDFYRGILGAFSKNTISAALNSLVELGAISTHKNPNPRYHFDKTKYFMFYPDVCNDWIEKNELSQQVKNEAEPKSHSQSLNDGIDSAKLCDRDSKINPPSHEIKSPCHKIDRAITDPTNKTTNKDHSINRDEVIPDKTVAQNISKEIEPIVNALKARGFPERRFQHADSIALIQKLFDEGASLELFLEAHEKALSMTEPNGFGVNYLAKVVSGLLARQALKPSRSPSDGTFLKPQIFETVIPAGIDWLDEEI